ncbi:MAG: class I SAM-dependent methyltransferase, partial [Gammaproteobacteria bacterium]
REYLKAQHVAGDALVQNAEQMGFPDETFDAVYSCGVLQHTPSIERAVHESWRVLKPGGKILIILYHRHSWFYLLHRVSAVNIEFAAAEAPIVNAYTRAELRVLFARFRDVQIRCEHYYPVTTTRSGALAVLYNRVFAPLARAIPQSILQGYGWHLVLTARK